LGPLSWLVLVALGTGLSRCEVNGQRRGARGPGLPATDRDPPGCSRAGTRMAWAGPFYDACSCNGRPRLMRPGKADSEGRLQPRARLEVFTGEVLMGLVLVWSL